jgi:translocation and assembly module TamB
VSEAADQAAPKRQSRWLKYLFILTGLAGLCALTLTLYINTQSFQALVRRRLVAEIERITGGRAEVGSFHTIPFRLQVEVRNITVHGSESANEIPLAHADSITAQLKLSSLLRSELTFHDLIVDQPLIHVVFYPGGSSNFPRMPGSVSGQSSLEDLFALSINYLEVRHGQMIWDDQIVPLDLSARDVSLGMGYSFFHARYNGHVSLGWVETKLRDFRPFAWMGAADFSLGNDSLIFTALKWNSGHSNFSGTGEISSFRRPRVRMRYAGHVDLTEAAAILRRRDLRAGVLDIKGDASGAVDQFSSNGQVRVQDFGWQDDHIAFSRAALTSDYLLSDQQLRLAKLQGKIFDGSFTGDAEVDQWLAPDRHLSASAKKALETAVISAAPAIKANPRQTRASKSSGVQNASISLRFRDLSAESVAAAFNSESHPIPDLHLAGLASGAIDTRWKGTWHDAEIQFSTDVAPPEHVAPPQLAISANASGTYSAGSDQIELRQFTLTTPASRVQASGTLSANSAMRLSVSTSSLADWLPIVGAVRGPALVPVTLNGRAAFDGVVNGAMLSPQLDGSLQVEKFEFNIPATAHSAPLKTQWDSLSAALQLSFDGMALREATLRRGEMSAEFNASSSLQHGHFSGESRIAVRAKLHEASIAVLQAVMGYNYPVTGNADVSVQVAGTLNAIRGDGQIQAKHTMAYGVPFQQFDSDFRFSRSELGFDKIRLIHDGSLVTGSAAFDPSSRAFQLDLAGNNFDLARISQIQADQMAVEGRVDFTIAGHGTPEAPWIDANMQIRKLALDHELAGDFALHATTEGNSLHLTGTSQLDRGSVQMAGEVQMGGEHSADLLFQMAGVDLDALWHRYLGHQLTGHSAASGSFRLRGPALRPAEWIADGDWNSLSLEVEKVKLHSQQPVRFRIAEESLQIQQLHLTGDASDLAGHGSIGLISPYVLDLAANGALDLKLASSLYPDLSAAGSVKMEMNLRGTFDDPAPEGRIKFDNGSISYASLPSGLNGIDGTLLFSRNRIQIEALSAHTGGGTLAFQGDATYLDQQLSFNLTASGKDVRLRYPPGVSSTADATLHWAGTRSASTVSGEILVNKIAITPGFDFGLYLERGRQGSPLTVANSPLYNVKLDIHVQTAPELQMRTAVARLSGDADLHLRGSLARPAVLGRVDILEGQATFHGTHFTLERGDITFANPVSIEPQLNLQAYTHVRNYDLNITVTGTPDRGLSLNYRSEPPLPKSDIIALLALGRTGDESTQLQEQSGQSTFSDQATALILNQALDSTVSNRLSRLFGASNIRIDPQGLVTETNPVSTGPQITIEQQFANNISLTYSTNVSQSSDQIIQGEYYINRNFSLVGTRDQNGVISFDVQVRQRKK